MILYDASSGNICLNTKLTDLYMIRVGHRRNSLGLFSQWFPCYLHVPPGTYDFDPWSGGLCCPGVYSYLPVFYYAPFWHGSFNIPRKQQVRYMCFLICDIFSRQDIVSSPKDSRYLGCGWGEGEVKGNPLGIM